MQKFVFATSALLLASYGTQKVRSFTSGGFTPKIGWEKVRQDIADILVKEGWDDGNLGPIFVRLAWHQSGTYDKVTHTGGSNGATMRFQPQIGDGANKGLEKAQEFLEQIKLKHKAISYADLWVLASYAAIEEMGGPKIAFTPGRVDAKNDKDCPPNGRLPDASQGAAHIRDVFYRMGLTDREIVSLIGGGHSLGRCHKDRSGYVGPWTNMPIGFTNRFFKFLFEREWKKKEWIGPLQFEDSTGKFMMLPTDITLKTDPNFRKWAILYKDDQEQFFNDFRDAFKKLTELGFVHHI